LFAPSRFATLADNEIKDRYRPETLPEAHFPRAVKEIRRGLLFSLLLVVGAVIGGATLGWILNTCFGSPTATLYRVLQLGGIGILLWATLGKQGWNLQTFAGDTLPERLDRAVYRTLYVFGSLLLALAVSWGA